MPAQPPLLGLLLPAAGPGLRREWLLPAATPGLGLGVALTLNVNGLNAPTSNVEEAEVEWFSEDLQDILELTHKKDILFIIGD